MPFCWSCAVGPAPIPDGRRMMTSLFWCSRFNELGDVGESQSLRRAPSRHGNKESVVRMNSSSDPLTSAASTSRLSPELFRLAILLALSIFINYIDRGNLAIAAPL